MNNQNFFGTFTNRPEPEQPHVHEVKLSAFPCTERIFVLEGPGIITEVKDPSPEQLAIPMGFIDKPFQGHWVAYTYDPTTMELLNEFKHTE